MNVANNKRFDKFNQKIDTVRVNDKIDTYRAQGDQ